MIASSGASLDDEALGTSDRDYGEHKGNMEGFVAELVVEAKPCWECRKNLREKYQPEVQLQPVSTEKGLPSLPDPRSCRTQQRGAT